ncbi:MAG: hypothetical protein AB1761_07500 [Pseudomonadota bacterium]
MPKVRVIKPNELDRYDIFLNDYYPALLAEGDSWFSLGAIPAYNMLDPLEFETFGAVVNLAYPGDTADDMRRALPASGGRRIDLWASELALHLADRNAYAYQGILLSAGGNDLIAAFPHLLRRGVDYASADPADPAALIDADALARFDTYLTGSLTGIVRYIREDGGPNRDAPIFTHTYDYPTPNDAPARILGVRVGTAWMYPKLVEAGVPQHLWVPVSDYLIEHMARLLRGLDLVDFHVVSTLGTIQRAALGATGSSGEWDNEIHPSRRGYAKLAAKMAAAIRAELGLP